MNSLEFIDREISSTEIDLWYSKRLLNENPPKEELKKEMLEVNINVLEKRMEYLQQIKTELEAWESVKSYLVDLGDVYVLAICNDDKEYLTLKKALEVN